MDKTKNKPNASQAPYFFLATEYANQKTKGKRNLDPVINQIVYTRDPTGKKRTRMKSNLITWAGKFVIWSLVVGLVWIPGCKKTKENPEAESSSIFNPKTPRVFLDEVYGDSNSFDGPRIQFTWFLDGEKNTSIWSIKPDGTDLRRTVSLDLLYTHGQDMTHPPVRSPNNRYLVVSMFSEQGIIKELFDLKNQTVKTIARGGFKPNFVWTKDSRKIIFVLDGDLVEYDLASEKLKKRKPIYSLGYYLTADNQRFYGVDETGFSIYDFQGKLIKKVEFIKGIDRLDHAVSDNGEYFFYNDGAESYIVRTSEPNKPIFVDQDNHRFSGRVFGPDNKYLYYRTGYLERVNIGTKEKEVVMKSDGGVGIGDLTIINKPQRKS